MCNMVRRPGRPQGSPQVPTGRDPHPDRTTHQRGPVAASAPDIPAGRLGLSLGSTPARAPPATLRKFAQGRLDALEPSVAPAAQRRPLRHDFSTLGYEGPRFSGPAPHAGPVADSADHAERLLAPRSWPTAAHARSSVAGLPVASRARAWGDTLCNINGPIHRPPPRLYSAWGTGTQ